MSGASQIIGPLHEETVARDGVRSMQQRLGGSSAELLDFPRRNGGAPLLMRQGVFERLLGGREIDLGDLPSADISAAQSDVKHLSLKQLLKLRVLYAELVEGSSGPQLQADFMAAVSAAMDQRVAERLGYGGVASEVARQVYLVYGASLHVGKGSASTLWLLRCGNFQAIVNLQICERYAGDVTPTYGYRVLNEKSGANLVKAKRQLHWEVELCDNIAEFKVDQISAAAAEAAENGGTPSKASAAAQRRANLRSKFTRDLDSKEPRASEAEASEEPPPDDQLQRQQLEAARQRIKSLESVAAKSGGGGSSERDVREIKWLRDELAIARSDVEDLQKKLSAPKAAPGGWVPQDKHEKLMKEAKSEGNKEIAEELAREKRECARLRKLLESPKEGVSYDESEKLKAELAETKRELAALKEQSKTAAAAAKDEMTKLRAESASAKEDARVALEQAEEFRKDLLMLAQETTAKEEQAEEANLNSSSEVVLAAEAEVARMRAELETVTAQSRDVVVAAEAKVSRITAELETVTAELQGCRAELEKLRALPTGANSAVDATPEVDADAKADREILAAVEDITSLNVEAPPPSVPNVDVPSSDAKAPPIEPTPQDVVVDSVYLRMPVFECTAEVWAIRCGKGTDLGDSSIEEEAPTEVVTKRKSLEVPTSAPEVAQ